MNLLLSTISYLLYINDMNNNGYFAYCFVLYINDLPNVTPMSHCALLMLKLTKKSNSDITVSCYDSLVAWNPKCK